MTEEEKRWLVSYRDLVEQGWAHWPRPPSLSHSDWWKLASDEDKVQGLVADWADWMQKRAERDGLRLETRIVFAHNSINYDFSYWAGAARLLGPGGETLEQIPFTAHRQGHCFFVDPDPEGEVRLKDALEMLYGPTLAAARSRGANELGPSSDGEGAAS